VDDRKSTGLLVDIDAGPRRNQATMLKNIGYTQLLQAGNGTDAWSMIKNFDVDYVISAWQLQNDLSGLGLLKVVRADSEYSNVCFFLVVEEVTKLQVLEAGNAGVTDMIIRPFTQETLHKKIHQALHPEEDTRLGETQRWLSQGRECMKTGNYDEAIKAFKSALAADESAEVYYNLGYINTARGRYEEAIINFRRATQIDRAFAEAYKMMGEAYSRLGRSDEAQHCLHQAAEIYMNKNLDAKAEDTFLKVLEVNPNTPNVFNSLGIIYRRQGKFAEAIRMYHKALKVNPRDEHIHYNLARSYLGVKKRQAAAELLKEAASLNPDFAEAVNLLKSITSEHG
jgi:tetratricopeptide (TPR) repeat protein